MAGSAILYDPRLDVEMVAYRLLSIKTMLFRRSFIYALTLIVATMLVCPAIDLVEAREAEPLESHCGSESSKAPEEMPLMQCCCDQDAIFVDAVHAPENDPSMHELLSRQREAHQIVFVHRVDHLPYHRSDDDLSKLSVLRL